MRPDMSPLSALVDVIAPRAPLLARPMPGGASTRRYFRVELPGGKTAVAMYVPDGDRPEEIVSANKEKEAAPRRWPFLEIRELLEAGGIAVPKLLGEDAAQGWLLLEDLGDDTLANFLARRPEDKTALYTRAVTDLAHAQAKLARLSPESVVATRAFDADLLRWELDHFREWGLDARGKTLPPDDRGVFDGIAKRLSRRIAGWPRGFTHRDYQSRNLMVRDANGEPDLVWIDFQDALLGPRVYDLVALLNDSYQEFDRPFVEARLDGYAREAKLDAAARAALGREFDLVTVQRKLKDAGRFVFIDRVKHNASFLPFVAPTMKKVALALERLADDTDMAALAALLRHALPDEA